MPTKLLRKIILYGNYTLRMQLLEYYLTSQKVCDEVMVITCPQMLRSRMEEPSINILVTTFHHKHLSDHAIWPCTYNPHSTTRLILLFPETTRADLTEAIACGAHGLLSDQAALNLLAQTLQAVSAGHFLFFGTPDHAASAAPSADTARPDPVQRTTVHDLTYREKQVLTLIAKGLRGKEIAASLGLSIRTVEKYRENLCRKTGLPDVANLTLMALKSGLLD